MIGWLYPLAREGNQIWDQNRAQLELFVTGSLERLKSQARVNRVLDLSLREEVIVIARTTVVLGSTRK